VGGLVIGKGQGRQAIQGFTGGLKGLRSCDSETTRLFGYSAEPAIPALAHGGSDLGHVDRCGARIGHQVQALNPIEEGEGAGPRLHPADWVVS
jgi:hypothetical protein